MLERLGYIGPNECPLFNFRALSKRIKRCTPGPSRLTPHQTPPRIPSSTPHELVPMPVAPDASNRHPGFRATPAAPDPQPLELVPPELPQAVSWPGPPLRTERMLARGHRRRLLRYKNERLRRPCARATLSSPFLGMSALHLMNVTSPRVAVISLSRDVLATPCGCELYTCDCDLSLSRDVVAPPCECM
jgi:hypothetical protein